MRMKKEVNEQEEESKRITESWYGLNPSKFSNEQLFAILEALHVLDVPDYEADNYKSGLTGAHSDIRSLECFIQETANQRNPQLAKANLLMEDALKKVKDTEDNWNYDWLVLIPVFNEEQFIVRAQISFDCDKLRENLSERFESIDEIEVSEKPNEAGFVYFECAVKLKEN